MVQISIESYGEQQLVRELMRWAENARDLRPAWDEVRNAFLTIEQKQFRGSGSRGKAGRWAPLSPRYLAWKRKNRLDLRILRATRRLMYSLTTPGHPDHVFRSSADEMFVGSRVPYGAYHQDPKRTGRLPRRPPVDLTERDKRELVQIIQTHLASGTGAGNGRMGTR